MSLRAEVRVDGRLEAAVEAGPGITVVFGPSGAGKTTLLHAVLGSLPARGTVALDGRVLLDSSRGIDLPVRARRIGLVDQEALLFPHLDVAANAAFGARGPEGRARARAVLERLGAASLAARRPATLSGGERRRVALARALAASPRALLLDEPLTGLDAPAREALGTALVAEQAAAGIPFLLVTHDAAEAFRLGHRLWLLEGGLVVRSGPPSQVLPGLGTETFLSGTVVRFDPYDGTTEVDLGGVAVSTGPLPEPAGARVALGLRAEDVLVCREPVRGTSARNLLAGTVASVETVAGTVHATVATPVPIRTVLTPGSARTLGIAPGARVHLLIKAQAFRRLP